MSDDDPPRDYASPACMAAEIAPGYFDPFAVDMAAARDAARFRMGYGGGFYDRTLAALRPRPYAIGIGLDAGRLPTIYPQPHDMALDLIVTETGAV